MADMYGWANGTQKSRIFYGSQGNNRLHWSGAIRVLCTRDRWVIIFTPSIPCSRYKSISVRLQESLSQDLIARRRNRYYLEKFFYIPYLHELAPTNSTRLWRHPDSMFPARACCRKWSPISVFRTTRETPLFLAHLIHTIIRNEGDGSYVIEVFLCIEMNVPHFGGRETERIGQLTQRALE